MDALSSSTDSRMRTLYNLISYIMNLTVTYVEPEDTNHLRVEFSTIPCGYLNTQGVQSNGMSGLPTIYIVTPPLLAGETMWEMYGHLHTELLPFFPFYGDFCFDCRDTRYVQYTFGSDMPCESCRPHDTIHAVTVRINEIEEINL